MKTWIMLILLTLWWIGQSGFVCVWANEMLVFDNPRVHVLEGDDA